MRISELRSVQKQVHGRNIIKFSLSGIFARTPVEVYFNSCVNNNLELATQVVKTEFVFKGVKYQNKTCWEQQIKF